MQATRQIRQNANQIRCFQKAATIFTKNQTCFQVPVDKPLDKACPLALTMHIVGFQAKVKLTPPSKKRTSILSVIKQLDSPKRARFSCNNAHVPGFERLQTTIVHLLKQGSVVQPYNFLLLSLMLSLSNLTLITLAASCRTHSRAHRVKSTLK